MNSFATTTNPGSGLSICVCLRLHDALASNYLIPIARHPAVKEIHVVRHAPVRNLDDPKIRYHLTGTTPLPLRLFAMYRQCRRLIAQGEVDAIVSFNPIPYGLLAISARGRAVIPYHLGFIGADIYGRLQASAWPFMRKTLSRADFITVTGEHMRERIIEIGGRPDRIAVLPHSIDVAKFALADDTAARFDFVFVGQLIHRKRVDLILGAMAELKAARIGAKLCVVGDGPLRGGLQNLAAHLGLADSVEFVGHSNDVETHLKRARILVMASESEGLPFAVVEAMSCGLVPISTNVGTISDLITDGETGFLVEKGSISALAARMKQLAVDRALYSRMRSKVLNKRQAFSYERATAVWDKWLRNCARVC